MMKNEVLRLDYVSTANRECPVLNNICLSLYEGEIIKLIGEQCEGTAALIDILSGIIQPDSGKVWIEGKEVKTFTPQNMKSIGVNIIHQKSDLIAEMTVMENLFLDQNEKRKKLLINEMKQIKKSREVLRTLEANISPDTFVVDLNPEQQHLVRLAKVLLNNPKILILDHSVMVLDAKQISLYNKIIKKLSMKNTSIMILTQNIDDFSDIAERIYIMRDTSIIGNIKANIFDRNKILRVITHEGFAKNTDTHLLEKDQNILMIENFCTKNGLKNISFNLKKGEVLGITGSANSGKTELAYAIYGMVKLTDGILFINGKKAVIKKPIQAIRNRIGLVPFDEALNGVFPNLRASENITISKLMSISKFGFISQTLENWLLDDLLGSLKIDGECFSRPVAKMNLGELRKLGIIRALANNPDILIFIEPTRNLNTEDRNQIMGLIMELSDRGKSIILISSDFYEIVRVASRVLILNNGMVTGEVKENEIKFDKEMN